jgi:hypothetical protein
MFGSRGRLKRELEDVTSKLEQLEKAHRELQGQSGHMWWRTSRLERQNEELQTWNRKLRDKNSALRRDRRRLRQLLEDSDIEWRSGS